MKIDPEKISEDNPEWTDRMFAESKPLKEAAPDLLKKLKDLKPRGRPKSENPKQHIGVRLDSDIVSWLRSHKGYNALINNALREKMIEETGA